MAQTIFKWFQIQNKQTKKLIITLYLVDNVGHPTNQWLKERDLVEEKKDYKGEGESKKETVRVANRYVAVLYFKCSFPHFFHYINFFQCFPFPLFI